jgi:cytochrome c-type biogenesis protein CcmH
LLWLVPPLALIGGGLALWAHGRRRQRLAAGENASALTLSAEEEARLQKLLAGQISPDAPA